MSTKKELEDKVKELESKLNKQQESDKSELAMLFVGKLSELTEAIALNTKAINYHANVVGFKADDENPTDSEGKQKVKLEAEVKGKQEDITFNHIKTAINMYAKSEGRDDALAMVAKFTTGGTQDIKDIPEEKWHDFFVACEV